MTTMKAFARVSIFFSIIPIITSILYPKPYITLYNPKPYITLYNPKPYITLICSLGEEAGSASSGAQDFTQRHSVYGLGFRVLGFRGLGFRV